MWNLQISEDNTLNQMIAYAELAYGGNFKKINMISEDT